jgi:outer membrane protein OmpA-like peptidoglycan-associated protein
MAKRSMARLCAPIGVSLPLIGLLIVAGTPVASAQSLFANNPNVRIDLSVLDELGPPTSLPSLLSPEIPRSVEGYNPSTMTATTGPGGYKPLSKAASAGTARLKPPSVSQGSKPVKQAKAKKSSDEIGDVAAQLAKAPPAAPKISPIVPVSRETAPEPPAMPAKVEAPKLPVASETPPAPPAMPTSQPMSIKPQAPEPPKAAQAPAAPPAPPPVAQLTAPEAPPIEPKAAKPTPIRTEAPRRPTETASLPDSSAPIEGGESLMQIVFGDGATKIPDSVLAELKGVVNRLNKDEESRLQLLAYAEGTDANASKARRLSLSRALAVRSYLIDQGVRSTRIDVRALGNKAPSGPSERVDVVLLKK